MQWYINLKASKEIGAAYLKTIILKFEITEDVEEYINSTETGCTGWYDKLLSIVPNCEFFK